MTTMFVFDTPADHLDLTRAAKTIAMAQDNPEFDSEIAVRFNLEELDEVPNVIATAKKWAEKGVPQRSFTMTPMEYNIWKKLEFLYVFLSMKEEDHHE